MGKSFWQMRQVGCLLVCAAMLKIPHLAGWRKAGPLWPGRTPAFWRCAVFGTDMLPQVSASPAISPRQWRPSANSLEAQLSLGKRASGAAGTNSTGQYASHILDTDNDGNTSSWQISVFQVRLALSIASWTVNVPLLWGSKQLSVSN